MNKQRLYLVEASYVFKPSNMENGQVRLPYSTGLLWSHCELNKEISDNYELSDILFVRTSPQEFLDEIHEPDIIGFSCFVWNWDFNKKLAEKVKEKYPNCIIVFGGQMQPTAESIEWNKEFFKEHPYVDILVHGEGELIFENILLENLKNKNWDNVNGITYKNGDGYKTTDKMIRINNIDEMPSPYLNGLMDRFVQKYKNQYKFTTTIESVRGCPYRCTYCEIGDLYFQKIHAQSLEKLRDEIQWMSDNEVVYIDNADSNFGLYFDRDLEIAHILVDLKKRTGYPETFRNDWAKDKGEKLIPIAQVLQTGDMNKGLTMALQSMNHDTLVAIKRKNIISKKDGIQDFLEKCNNINLPVYAEFILGLPQETLDSFKDAIYKLINYGQHNYVGVYPLSILPNTPFGNPEYVDKYGLETIKTKGLYYHITEEEIEENESEQICVSTKTMPYDDMMEAYDFRWFIMITHFFGLVQVVSRFLNSTGRVGYREFYEDMWKYFKDTDSVLGKEIKEYQIAIRKVFTEERYWGWFFEESNYTWEFDEGSFIKLVDNIDLLYKEVENYLGKYFDDKKTLDAVLDYQKEYIVNVDKQYPFKKEFDINIKDVIEKNEPVKNGGYVYEFDTNSKCKNYNNNKFDWCRELFWWGRKEGRYKTMIEEK
tara:strand:+ start:3102 stop:5060 length:1959 start_codon:yes stop_codon:yes gene_type:complete